MSIRSLLSIAVLLITGILYCSAQNLSAYVNIRNEFYAFEDSFTHQLDYLPPLSYKIGGNAIAFIVAMLAIKSFIGILNKHGFKGFGVYRIIIGGLLIILFLAGIKIAVV